MKNLEEIKKKIVPTAYICDECGACGDITNMGLIIGEGIYHYKCLKNRRNRNVKKES